MSGHSLKMAAVKRLRLALLAVAVCMPVSAQASEQASPRKVPETLALPLVKPRLGDFEAMRERRIVRILVPYSRTLFFIDRGRRQGVAAELGWRFEDWLNKRYRTGKFRMQVVFVPTRRDQILPALERGLGDIAAANLTVTPERERQVAFAPPWSDKVAEILVTGPAAPALATIEDLSGREVHVRASSSYALHLQALSAALTAKGREPIRITALDERLEDEDVLDMVQAGLLPFAVVDDHKAKVWSAILPKLTPRPDLAVASQQSVGWAFRKGSPQLAAVLSEFVAEHRLGTAIGNDIVRRYFSSDKLLKNAHAEEARQRFDLLEVAFRQHGQDQGFDWLMLAAQGFQESQLDQSRRSRRGAVGIMQLLPATAADKAVGVTGIERDAAKNIMAGAIYLRYLIRTYIKDTDLPDTERVLFAFAAYNAGPGNLRKFRAKAKQMGLDPDRWFDNVEHAAAATVGRETVDYVANIYKYYIAYRMLRDRQATRCEAPMAAAPQGGGGVAVAAATAATGCELKP